MIGFPPCARFKRGPTQLLLLLLRLLLLLLLRLLFVSRHSLGQLVRELRESSLLCRCSLRVLPAVVFVFVVVVFVRWC